MPLKSMPSIAWPGSWPACMFAFMASICFCGMFGVWPAKASCCWCCRSATPFCIIMPPLGPAAAFKVFICGPDIGCPRPAGPIGCPLNPLPPSRRARLEGDGTLSMVPGELDRRPPISMLEPSRCIEFCIIFACTICCICCSCCGVLENSSVISPSCGRGNAPCRGIAHRVSVLHTRCGWLVCPVLPFRYSLPCR